LGTGVQTLGGEKKGSLSKRGAGQGHSRGSQAKKGRSVVGEDTFGATKLPYEKEKRTRDFESIHETMLPKGIGEGGEKTKSQNGGGRACGQKQGPLQGSNAKTQL